MHTPPPLGVFAWIEAIPFLFWGDHILHIYDKFDKM